MPSTAFAINNQEQEDIIIMDTSMLSSDNDPMKEDSDTFIFCDIEQDLTDSEDDDSDDDEDDDSDMSSDDEDDAALDAAEELLKGIQEKRTLRPSTSFNSVASLASLASMGSSLGSLGSIRGRTPEQIEEHMVKRSVKNMNLNVDANSASVADLQALLAEHQEPKKKPEPTRMAPSRRASSGNLAGIGHIGQATSAQKVEADDGAINPDEHLAKLLGGKPQRFTYDSLEGFFLPSRPEYTAAWTNELTKAVREHDLAALEAMHKKGQMLQACNNFGESIVHLTVRRGTPEMLRFLLQDADVSMRVCCDLGRTPIHDAAWCLASNPKSYQMMALLLNESPMQLLITDKRGYTPLSYVPRAKWAECNAFLDRQLAKGRFASMIAQNA